MKNWKKVRSVLHAVDVETFNEKVEHGKTCSLFVMCIDFSSEIG